MIIVFNSDVFHYCCVYTWYITSIKLLRIFVNVLKSYIVSWYNKACKSVDIYSLKRLYYPNTMNFRKKLYPKFTTKTNETIQNYQNKNLKLASDVQ